MWPWCSRGMRLLPGGGGGGSIRLRGVVVCSCEILGFMSVVGWFLGFMGFVPALAAAAQGGVSPVGLGFMVLGATVGVVCMVARRSLQVASRRLGYRPTGDGGVRVRAYHASVAPHPPPPASPVAPDRCPDFVPAEWVQ